MRGAFLDLYMTRSLVREGSLGQLRSPAYAGMHSCNLRAGLLQMQANTLAKHCSDRWLEGEDPRRRGIRLAVAEGTGRMAE